MKNMALKLLTTLSAICLASSTLHATSIPHYAILMDAGSTGTRAHLFEYHDDAVPTITDLYSVSTKPGLSSYKDKPQDAHQAIEPLVRDIHNFLVNKKIAETNVDMFILATAGMRLLSEEEQKAIYKDIKTHLETNYAYSIKSINTISGDDEALYNWLDINYLNNTFTLGKSSLGTLDMGGASTQIAFEVNDSQQKKSNHSAVSHLMIGNRSYSIFKASFLGLGQDKTREIINENNAAYTCYPKDYLIKNTKGAFSLAACQQQYRDAALSRHKEMFASIPTPTSHFVAFSGFYYQFNFFKADPNPVRESFQQKVNAVCKQSWEELKQQYPSQPTDYLATYCANASYHDVLLYELYGLPDNNITVAKKINDKEIDWTLGALLYFVTQDTKNIYTT